MLPGHFTLTPSFFLSFCSFPCILFLPTFSLTLIHLWSMWLFHLFITWLHIIIEGQLLPLAGWRQNNYSRQLLDATPVKDSQQIGNFNHTGTYCFQETIREDAFFFSSWPIGCLWVAGCRAQSPSCDTQQFSWQVKSGRAPSNRQQGETKGRKINSSVFCKLNVSWQQNAPFVIRAASFRKVIRHCLSLDWTTLLHYLLLLG